MKCKKLVVITGISCQGKTYTAMRLKEKLGCHVIHTDTFYHPIGRDGLSCKVGEEDEEKDRLIREHLPLLTEITVIEGSHVANREELDIFIRELGFNGELFIFKMDSEDLEKRFKEKYKDIYERQWEDLNRWFKGIYNLNQVYIVSSAEEIICFIDGNGSLCISG